MRIVVVVALAVAALTPGTHGQSSGPKLADRPQVVSHAGRSGSIETAHVLVTAGSASARVAPGERVTLFVDVRPKPRMHVYAPQQKEVIPVSLTLAAGDFAAHAPLFPRPERYLFAPLNETQLVYSRPFRIEQTVTVRPAAAARRGSGGTLSISGSLRYQACDDTICYMPVDIPLAWRLGLAEVKR